MNEQTKIELENLVHYYGMTEMLSVLAEIASDEAALSRRNDRGEATVKGWDNVTRGILSAATLSAEYFG